MRLAATAATPRAERRIHNATTMTITNPSAPITGPAPVACENAMPLLNARLKRSDPTRSIVRPPDNRLSAQCLVSWSAITIAAITSHGRRTTAAVIDCRVRRRAQ